MNKNSVYVIVLLTLIWVILREDISVLSVIIGISVSVLCVFFCSKFIPLPKSSNINILRLALYLLFLLKEIYKAGFWAIKVILTGSRVEIMDMKTVIKNQFSRTALANSITIVPGSISLDLKDDTITVLWLAEKGWDRQQTKDAALSIIGKMEKMLLKVQE